LNDLISRRDETSDSIAQPGVAFNRTVIHAAAIGASLFPWMRRIGSNFLFTLGQTCGKTG
jgi:hypothetical protein